MVDKTSSLFFDGRSFQKAAADFGIVFHDFAEDINFTMPPVIIGNR